MQTPTIEPLLLTAARVSTFDGKLLLTGASGFFFEREDRLFLVTSRHVLTTNPANTFPTELRSNSTRTPGTSPVPLVFRCLFTATAKVSGERAAMLVVRLMSP